MKSELLSGRWCWAASILSMAVIGGRSVAEEATATSEGPTALQEIVVTAQRRSENIQRTALAVDVVSTEALGLAGASRASDLPNAVPALQVGEFGNGQQSLYIRSVGTMTANSYSDPAVAFNVDGVAIGRPSSMTGVMYDLQRVEVLKGPQGTLYGRNATGGAINILPNLPKLGVTSAELALTVGNHSEVHPEAALNLAVSDNSAARFAFTYAHHDGYQTDGTGDANNYAGRAQYLFRPSDSFSVRLAADYAHDGGHNIAGTLLALQSPFTGEVTHSTLPRDVGLVDPRVSALFAGQYSFISGRFFGPIDGTPHADNRFWGVLGEIVWHSPIGTLTLLPAHRDSKLNDFTTALGFGEYADEHDHQTSVELRLASENEGLLRWLVGGYYFDEDVRALYQFNQQALAPIQTLETGTTSGAAFAHLTLAPVDQFRITGGLRYTHDHKSFDGLSQVLLSACTLTSSIPACPGAPLIPLASSFASASSQLQLFPIIPNALYGSALPNAAASLFPLDDIPINQTETFTKITWHAGLEYDLSANSLIYASWDTGYHAGGFAFAQIKPTYNPESLSAYSIGSKNRFLHDALQLNLEAFYWKYRDQQISHGATDLNGTYVFYTDNAGSSSIKGGEIELKYLLPTRTVFNLDVQYLDAVYDSFTYQTPAGGTNGPPVTGCPFSQSDTTHYTVNCSGKTPLESPKWTATAGIQQMVQLGTYALIGEFTAHYQTASLVGFEMVPVERQSAFAESNVSLTLAADSERWSVTAFANNLQDKRPYGNAYYNSIMNVYAASVGAPRTLGIHATLRF
jgi:iron complex outermembrane recepter protein